MEGLLIGALFSSLRRGNNGAAAGMVRFNQSVVHNRLDLVRSVPVICVEFACPQCPPVISEVPVAEF
jgi:hypothetical protein